ncbi:hypothetical protein ACFL6N_00695 [Thermodesulfobacteriota bacterium]
MRKHQKSIQKSPSLLFNQRGAFPLNELAIVMVLIVTLGGSTAYGFISGNWFVLQGCLGILFTLFVISIVVGSNDDKKYRAKEKIHYDDLVCFLQSGENVESPEAVEEARKIVLDNEIFPVTFYEEAEELLELYKKVHRSLRDQALNILLRVLPFNLQTLEVFLETPVNEFNKKNFRFWLGCKPEALKHTVTMFQHHLADESRTDHAILIELLIELAKGNPDPDYALALKPFRSSFEMYQEKFDRYGREKLERYIAYWDAENNQL